MTEVTVLTSIVMMYVDKMIKKNVIFKVMKHSFILVLIGPVNLEASTNNSLKFFPYTGTTLTIIQLIKTRFLGIILTVT